MAKWSCCASDGANSRRDSPWAAQQFDSSTASFDGNPWIFCGGAYDLVVALAVAILGWPLLGLATLGYCMRMEPRTGLDLATSLRVLLYLRKGAAVSYDSSFFAIYVERPRPVLDLKICRRKPPRWKKKEALAT